MSKKLNYFYKTKDGKGWIADDVERKELVESGKYVEITKAEWDEHYASFHQHREPSESQLKKRQIAALKAELAKSDYKALKYAEGWISEEEYAPIKAERQALRDRINELESEL